MWNSFTTHRDPMATRRGKSTGDGPWRHRSKKSCKPFVVNQLVPMSEYVRTLFRNYREIRVRVLGHLKDSSANRANLTKKFRRSKSIKGGMKLSYETLASARLEGELHSGNLTPNRLSYSKFMEINARFAPKTNLSLQKFILKTWC